MSQTSPTPPTAQEAMNESLISPQFILAGIAYAIVACVLAAVMWRGDAAQVNLVLGFVFAFGGAVSQFYFGSSKSSQVKDATIAAKVIAPSP